jgi:phosphate transport system permease protein
MIWLKSSISFPSPLQLPIIDTITLWTLRASALLAGGILGLILLYLVRESLPVLSDIGLMRMLTDTAWSPTENLFNLLPMIWGSLLVMTLSVILAAPIGIMSAVFCHFYAGAGYRLVYRRLMGVLAGIPSVVYGFWGLMVVVPFINRLQPPGASLLAASIVLSIMILPTFALMAEAAIGSVPRPLIAGAQALGLDRSGILKIAVFPAARSGIFTGLILTGGRAIGETMAVIMVCGNIVQFPTSVFDPVRTLTANIALEMAYATGNHRSALFVTGLVLLLMVVGLIAAAESVERRRKHA